MPRRPSSRVSPPTASSPRVARPARPAPSPLGVPSIEVLTTFQAARELGVVFSTVNYWVDDGTLPGFRTPGGHRRIRREDLEAFKAARGFAGPSGSRRSLLLVEDDHPFRRALKRNLAKADLPVDVLEADNGFDAGRLIVEKRPVVVVLDIHLPGVDGFEVMRQVGTMPHRPGIVAISGHAPGAYEARSRRLGAAAFLAKPFDPERLVRVIRGLLGVQEASRGD